MSEQTPTPPASDSSTSNTEEYNEALDGLKKARKQAYTLLIAGIIVLLLLFALGFYWLGSLSKTDQGTTSATLAEEQTAAFSQLLAELEIVEGERDQLNADNAILRESLATSTSKVSALETSLEAAEAAKAEAVEAAVASEVEVALQALIDHAAKTIDGDWDEYMSLREKAAALGLAAGSSMDPLESTLGGVDDATESLPAILAYQRDLARATVELEEVLASASSAGQGTQTNAYATAATGDASESTQAQTPEALFAFLKSPAAESWSYTKDLSDHANTGLTYEFVVENDGKTVRVPFYSYDVWKQRLKELEEMGETIQPSLYAFTSYEEFARSIPYLQTIGLYVGPKVSFRQAQVTQSK